MKALFKTLTVVHFLLTAAALTIGCMLFSQRELLKGRTQVLESNIVALTAFVEDEPGRAGTSPNDPARDLDACDADILADDEIERSTFWNTYPYDMEVQDPLSMLTVDKQELGTYYLRDGVTGKILKDSNGRRLTQGEGTMHNMLAQLQLKISRQYARLNDTRGQLTKTRGELVSTVEELNTKKKVLRDRLVHIVALDGVISERDTKIADLEADKSGLEEEISEQQLAIADLHKEIGQLQETFIDEKDKVRTLKERIAILEIQLRDGKPIVRSGIARNDKGIVKGVDKQWKFLVVDLNDTFISELLGKNAEKKLPVGLELYVERRNGESQFVSKVTLQSLVTEEKIGIFDIVPGWEQTPAKAGDILYFR